ncbi:response regulator transcription factor [Cohnella fermenti]|uniref:Response regulator transcription factor n=1 Tax=Cohnella fermenti TaxID=2565925 RepID=A0A4V3WEN5_9BACL|nr:response regulator transcription factor [Cohnella fermenti]THF77074.1 response regulator transcription factor [Cohnella fermenti]
MSSRLLLVEDDESLHRGIEFTLRQEGYEVTGARRIREAEAAVQDARFDLIILDVQLPDGSGFDFCSRLRTKHDTPVVFLTASDSELDIVRGLDLGGDDYITKPFRLREFLSRIQAVLRRHRGPSRGAHGDGAVQAGDLTLYPQEMRLTKQGSEISLSMTEFRLLSLLMNHPRAVLSKEQILQQLWQDGSEYMDDNTIAVNVRRLREKIEDTPNHPQKIITVRGAGYRWNG